MIQPESATSGWRSHRSGEWRLTRASLWSRLAPAGVRPSPIAVSNRIEGGTIGPSLPPKGNSADLRARVSWEYIACNRRAGSMTTQLQVGLLPIIRLLLLAGCARFEVGSINASGASSEIMSNIEEAYAARDACLVRN